MNFKIDEAKLAKMTMERCADLRRQGVKNVKYGVVESECRAELRKRWGPIKPDPITNTINGRKDETWERSSSMAPKNPSVHKSSGSRYDGSEFATRERYSAVAASEPTEQYAAAVFDATVEVVNEYNRKGQRITWANAGGVVRQAEFEAIERAERYQAEQYASQQAETQRYGFLPQDMTEARYEAMAANVAIEVVNDHLRAGMRIDYSQAVELAKEHIDAAQYQYAA